jgi:hypothetical protein
VDAENVNDMETMARYRRIKRNVKVFALILQCQIAMLRPRVLEE